MTWALAGLAVAGGITSAIEANQTRQRNKGIISLAYALGSKRLNLGQMDTRQSQAESLGARGLSGGGGGGVRDAGPIGPATGAPLGVGGAHDLGGQAVVDERREQQLEQTGLQQESQNELSANNAAASAAELTGGIQAGGAVAAAVAGRPPATTIPAAPTLSGDPTAGIGVTPSTPPGVSSLSPYANAWGGIDPISPTSRGAWGSPDEGTGSFNTFNHP